MGVFQDFGSGDKELLQALKEFTIFRKEINMALTDEDKNVLCKKLEAFPREQWVPIIRQSIEKRWARFYPVKEAETGRNFKISTDSAKYASSPSFLKAIRDLLDEAGSDGRWHGTV